jgi:nitrogen fixation/metabolism regulation signal transduction histidine kinase
MSVTEEMQSSNEELETSKEELQSLNEELTTANAQLEGKIGELEASNNDLDNLLTSTNIATLFLDTKLCIRGYTPAATRLFGLISSDVGRPISDIAPKFSDPSLLTDAAAVLETATAAKDEVQGHDGRWYVRQVLPYRTRDGRTDGVVMTFSDVAAEALHQARRYAESIVDTVREPLLGPGRRAARPFGESVLLRELSHLPGTDGRTPARRAGQPTVGHPGAARSPPSSALRKNGP